MPGKVFVSCGQGSPREKRLAKNIVTVLRAVGLYPYVAVTYQRLDDVSRIIEELRTSDYYLFVDFHRPEQQIPISLFTHQELALAHSFGFGANTILLQEEGAPRSGLLWYLQGNAVSFRSDADVLRKLRSLLKQRQWIPSFYRSLVPESLGIWEGTYADHTGQSLQKVWQVVVSNRRQDIAAVDTVCVLAKWRRKGGRWQVSPDRAYLKWAAQADYRRTILPGDSAAIDVLAIHAYPPGLFLHSLRDTARQSLVRSRGRYEFRYRVFARDFPVLEFTVQADVRLARRRYWATSMTVRLS